MATRIDLLLTKPSNRSPRRLGDIGRNSPYVILSVKEEDIILQMPVNITSNNEIMWDQKDFTADSIRGAAAIDIYNKTGDRSVLESVIAGGKGIGSGIAKDAVSGVGSAAAGVDGAGDYVLHKWGKAVNPNKEMTFSGIGYRAFTFEFEFIPLNRNASKNIKEFIAFFQEKSMPDFAGNETVYFAYPDTWSINFAKADWLPKIMPCYLTDYSINYGGAGKMVAHEDSSVQTNISLTFTESQLHTRSKITKEGYVG